MNKLNQQYFETREIHKKNYKKYGWILWASVLFVLVLWIFWEIKSQINENILVVFDEEKNQICLNESEFKIGMIDYLDNPDSIKLKIGEPDSTKIDLDMNSEIWFYDNIDIGLTNEHIYYIWSKDEIVTTPSGIKIGLTKEEVSRILFGKKNRKYKIDLKASHVQIVNCKTEFYLILEFYGNSLQLLEMGIDLP